MSQTYDAVATTVTLGDGQSLSGQDGYLTVDGSEADHVRVVVDDGSGNAPASHDIVVEAHKSTVDDYLQVGAVRGTTDRVFDVTSPGDDVRVDLIDQTSDAGTDTYRIHVESLRINSMADNGQLFD